MKSINKKISYSLVIFLAVLLSTGCSSDWDSYYNEKESSSAYDLLKADAVFSDFLQLIEFHQLDYLLKASVVTVFAPVNGGINTAGLSESEVKYLLRQHIVSGRVTADLASGKKYYASNGAVLVFDSAFSYVNGIEISEPGTQLSGSVVHKIASLMTYSSKETLYGFLKKNKLTYSYIFSLFDNVSFDEKASIKYVGENGKMIYDSVFLAKSSVLDPYLSSTDFYTVILFTDQQFENSLSLMSDAAKSAISATPSIKKGLISATVIQSFFQGTKNIPAVTENWNAVNGFNQTIDPARLSSKVDIMQQVTVLHYNDLTSNLATNYFSLKIQGDEYNLSGTEGASGGGNAHEVISVPVYEKGNGLARRIYPNSMAGNSHAFYTIGGNQKGTFVAALNGVTYTVRMAVSLTRSIKCILWVYDAGTADKRLYLDSDGNFDTSKYFICGTLNGGMRLIEFPAQTLYTRVANGAPTFKFHIDYRNIAVSSFPKIDGVTPTLAQTGIIIDYLEFIPVLY
jgi:hypothetical protein